MIRLARPQSLRQQSCSALLETPLTMTNDPPSKPGSPEQVPIADPTLQALTPSPVPSVRRQGRRVRDLILDYALGSAILGLLPISRLFTLKLLLAFGLIIKMSWDIGKAWHFRPGQDLLARIGVFFGSLGALAMAFMAWLTFWGLGVFVPYLQGLALAAALFTLSWGQGQVVNQFYASGEMPE